MRKPQLIWVAALAALGGGCSLIYDPGSFTATDAAQQPDGMPDARPVDAKINDADIENLDILGTLPVDLAEGSGCVWDDVGLACTEDARAIPIIVTGANIDASAVVTLDGAGYTAQIVPAAVHENHEQLAIAVRIPPDLGIDDTGTATLTITVTQGAAASDFTEVTVAGLNDFIASTDVPGGTLDIDSSPLDTRYATINIDSNIRFTGNEPVRLVATSAITLDAELNASGFDGANGATGAGAAGPGGCPGGAPGAPGLCGDGGGRGGAVNVGGGGGGHRTDGTMGTGPGGAAGEASGNERLGLLGGETGSRGNGGGGGGNAGLGAAGGSGGGGGGTIVLTSEGSLTVTSSGVLRAAGGVGAIGGGACLLNQHGGGGGGGSGGALLVRARATFAAEDNMQRAFVNAGSGGDTPTGAGCNDGGAGAPGRVRIDLASGSADPGMVSGTTPFRGIAIDPALPPVVTTAQVAVGVFGAPNETYRIQVEGQSAEDVSTLGNRTGSAMVDLLPGMNRVCVLVDDTVTAASDEGAQCVSIAFMPQ